MRRFNLFVSRDANELVPDMRISHDSKFSRLKPVFGVTLVELLVVLGIIALLVGLLLPAIQMVRESARNAACSSNLRQIGIAVLNFEASQHRLPPGMVGYAEAVPWDDFRNRPTGIYWKHKSQASFLVLILPYIEQGSLADQAHPALFDLNRDVTTFRRSNGTPFGWVGELPFFADLCESRVEISIAGIDVIRDQSPVRRRQDR